MATPVPTQAPNGKNSKSNLWLIIIIILVVGVILWPILRPSDSPSDLPTELESPESETGTNADESVTAPTSLTDNPVSVVSNPPPVNTNLAAVAAPTSGPLVIRVYFRNKNLDPQGERCQAVLPIARTVARTSAVGRAALLELLKGVSPSDAAIGLSTAINSETKLQSLTIAGGVARADFSRELAALEPAAEQTCLAATLKAQITETLKQFSTVKAVVVSVNGQPI
ncbi:MAG: GerMN domain-containing protein [Patescibacteria group bacterium]